MVSDLQRVHRRFAEEIEGESWPRPVCPTCMVGHVAWSTPEKSEGYASRNEHDHPGFEPGWISGTFHSIGRCENTQCTQVVVATGTYRVKISHDQWHDEYQGTPYSDYYTVEHFSPPLALIPLPEEVPQDVRDAVDRAATLLFVDPSFAATALRAAIERFMTSQGISATRKNGKPESVDERIRQWRVKTGQDRAAGLFLATKWLGNEGAHEGPPLTVSDVLDGLAFIDSAFHSLFIAPDVDARMKAVNLHRGRPKASDTTADL